MQNEKFPSSQEIGEEGKKPDIELVGKSFGRATYNLQCIKDFGQHELKELVVYFHKKGINPRDFWEGYRERSAEHETELKETAV